VIITRTPLRISFAGGGTDLPSYYRYHGGGAVTSAAIGRYVHVLVNPNFDRSIRATYSQTENVPHFDQLQHGIIREAMRLTGVTEALEIHTIADIPGEGTGLGSSSSLAVGLLHALYAYQGMLKDPAVLAAEACEIEIDVLHGTLGKQDQYVAAFGGVDYIEFQADDTVRCAPIPLTTQDRESLSDHLSLFYTGRTRKAQGILTDLGDHAHENRGSLERMRELAGETRDTLMRRDWARLGALVDEGWHLKRGLSEAVSDAEIDQRYAAAKAAGAYGGKIAGAGGGGFLLLVHPPEQTRQISEALSPMMRLPVRIAPEGSRILFVSR